MIISHIKAEKCLKKRIYISYTSHIYSSQFFSLEIIEKGRVTTIKIKKKRGEKKSNEKKFFLISISEKTISRTYNTTKFRKNFIMFVNGFQIIIYSNNNYHGNLSKVVFKGLLHIVFPLSLKYKSEYKDTDSTPSEDKFFFILFFYPQKTQLSLNNFA